MKPEIEHQSAAQRHLRKIIWLAIPTWLCLAVELVGEWRFEKDTYAEKYAIYVGPFWYPFTWGVVALAIVSPLLIGWGFAVIFSKWRTIRLQKGWLPSLLLLLAFSLLAGMFSCAWSCSGHPTWMGGYR
jgi:hypothetical protein